VLATTHLAFNHTLYLGTSLLFNHTVTVPEVIALTLASPVPDIDTPKSFMGKLCPPFSRWLESVHGHRTITHSVWALLATMIVCAPLLWWNHLVWLAIVAGIFFHIAGDTFTRMGPMFFYPQVQARFVSLIPEYRFQTGGTYEKIVFGILCCCVVGLYSLQGPGILGLMQSLLGNLKLEQEQMTAQVQAEFRYSKTELDDLLARGIIDRMEYNQLLEDWKLTWIEAGRTPEEVEAMMQQMERQRAEQTQALQQEPETNASTQGCLAVVERVDGARVYVRTSPTCLRTPPEADGTYRVEGLGAVTVGAEVQLPP
jgi:inner membrane protein